LSTWVIPNYHELANYSQLRSSLAAERIGFFAGVWRNLQAAAVQIFQSFSPLMVALLLLSSKFIRKEDLKEVWPVILSPVAGALLMLITAFFNYPEPRYFCAVMLPLSIVLAAAFAKQCRSSNKGSNFASAGILLASTQALLLCFQSAPAVPSEAFTNPNPIFTGLGINDAFLRTKIPFYPAGDPWKQTWMFQYIENIERNRLVYLNVLSNSFEYNQGTLVCLSRMRHSPVCPTTWRTCMPDQTDSFNFTEQDLHSMQWVLLQKNGASTHWYDKASKEKYDEVVNKLESGEQFIEAAKQPLPDKSELILYRNKYWMFTRPGEKPDPRLSATSNNQAHSVQ
ncbi:MAG: hypothetical protein K2X81_10255, partial [Candidatus Obscuribacterales bacterium]|nr:hypothetical protein [Candidatus Obscuribacterales bacterium]